MAGYNQIFGGVTLIEWKLKGGVTVNPGDLMALSGGYLTPAASGANDVIGVTPNLVSTAGAADGDITITVNVDPSAVYEVAIGNGTGTVAMQGAKCDVHAAQSIDVTSATDGVIQIHTIDTVRQTARVSIRRAPSAVA